VQTRHKFTEADHIPVNSDITTRCSERRRSAAAETGCKQVIDAKGQTLPFTEAVCNSLEFGITATQQTTTLYVDDIKVSEKPLLK
jgi:hypothetical protein